MPPPVKIVLFEDTDTTRVSLLEALRTALGDSGEVLPFEAVGEGGTDETYVARLRRALGAPPLSDATMILADQDLSKSPQMIGLSVNAVAAAAKRLGIPVCSYARQVSSEYDAWRGSSDEGHLILTFEGGEAGLAAQAALVARGFASLTQLIAPLAERGERFTAATMMARALGHPDTAEKIALYAVGDQSRFSEVMTAKDAGLDKVRHQVHFLGYWLWESLLKYPGLIVNGVAAASHLDIDTASFSRAEVRGVFDAALYSGPFADSGSPSWWRGLLDDEVSREGCDNGRELVLKKGFKDVQGSKCRVDPSKRAGYYCIISRMPVSWENSKGGLSWLPRGADLTRISNDKFDEYGPWLGV